MCGRSRTGSREVGEGECAVLRRDGELGLGVGSKPRRDRDSEQVSGPTPHATAHSRFGFGIGGVGGGEVGEFGEMLIEKRSRPKHDWGGEKVGPSLKATRGAGAGTGRTGVVGNTGVWRRMGEMGSWENSDFF